ncbi:MAG: alpha/beta hydrolase [Prolixibacteraceae bacterium]
MPETGKSYSHTDDMVALLDYLGIKQAHILGHSFGGNIAIDFALKYPERTITLILPDAPPPIAGFIPSEQITSWLGGTWKAGRDSGIQQAKEIWIKGAPFVPAMQNPKSAAKLKQMIDDYSGWQWVNNDPYIGIAPYSPEILSKIQVPTLIIVGELDLTDYKNLADIQKRYIPNSKEVILSGAGHALSIENPEEFNQIVLSFLADFKNYK